MIKHSKNYELVKRYLELVEKMELTEDTAKGLLHHNYHQHELPNHLNKHGQKCNAAESFKRMQTAKGLLSSQTYDVKNVVEQDNTVVIEAQWTGTVAVNAGEIRQGSQMKAHFCMFFEIEDGLVHHVRNYDCYEQLE